MAGQPSTDNQPLTHKQLSVLQINLRHSKAASASLAQLVVENKFDIVLIQEPFAVFRSAPIVDNIPPGYIVYHALDFDHAYGAAILVRLGVALEGRATNCSKSNFMAAIDLQLPTGLLRIISLYIRHSCTNPASLLLESLSDF